MSGAESCTAQERAGFVTGVMATARFAWVLVPAVIDPRCSACTRWWSRSTSSTQTFSRSGPSGQVERTLYLLERNRDRAVFRRNPDVVAIWVQGATIRAAHSPDTEHWSWIISSDAAVAGAHLSDDL